MRSLALIVLAPLLAQARVCGSSGPAQPVQTSASASVSANAMLPLTSKHGGTIVTVDDVDMELVVKGDGEVVAYPVQATAAVTPTLTADANVTVEVPVDSGGTRPVHLVWSPVEARFVGRVQGATVVTTRPADVNVTVVSHGRRRHGRAERVIVAPAVVVATPGVVVARPGVVVAAQAPRATVVVTAPPPPVVRVQAPVVDVRIGGGVVVDDGYHHDNGKHRGWDHDGHHDEGHAQGGFRAGVGGGIRGGGGGHGGGGGGGGHRRH